MNHFFPKVHLLQVQSNSNVEDLLIIQIIQILDIIVDKEYWYAFSPNSIEFKFGRSIHHHYHLQSLPSMTKEEKQKL